MEKTEESTVKVMRDDEDTLGIFHEYTQKFVEAIQQEKERVKKQALKESNNIIAEAVKKAQKTYDKATGSLLSRWNCRS